MSAQHTPGPWGPDPLFPISGNASVDIHAGATCRNPWIASVMGPHVGPTNPAEVLANAALIAAAPDLLAALRAIVKLSDDMDPEGLFQSLEYINARAAIAKAEGRT